MSHTIHQLILSKTTRYFRLAAILLMLRSIFFGCHYRTGSTHRDIQVAAPYFLHARNRNVLGTLVNLTIVRFCCFMSNGEATIPLAKCRQTCRLTRLEPPLQAPYELVQARRPELKACSQRPHSRHANTDGVDSSTDWGAPQRGRGGRGLCQSPEDNVSPPPDPSAATQHAHSWSLRRWSLT